MERQKNENNTQPLNKESQDVGKELSAGSLCASCSNKSVEGIKQDPTDNWLELYTKFKNKCWRHGITDKEEIVLLYDIL